MLPRVHNELDLRHDPRLETFPKDVQVTQGDGSTTVAQAVGNRGEPLAMMARDLAVSDEVVYDLAAALLGHGTSPCFHA